LGGIDVFSLWKACKSLWSAGRLWKAEWFFKDTNSLISGPLNILCYMKKKDFTDIIMVLEIEKLSWSQTGAAEGKS
jgi:hypothetical protein